MNDLSASPNHYYLHKRPEMLKYLDPQAQKILDIGCSSGGFINELKALRTCEVWGIELNSQAAQSAAKVADRVLQGDVFAKINELPNDFFHTIFCNDILEHLSQPFDLLEGLKQKLKSHGQIIISIPNVRYVKNLFNLLIKKDWQYTNEGVLDRTHLRFFTKKSMTRSLLERKWSIEKVEGIYKTKLNYIYFVLNMISVGLLSDAQFMNYVFVIRAGRS
jgi:2-polyprenyl-3-methyl-5-hydroxy-6-metoxy-1,4-benzoquinol methylase